MSKNGMKDLAQLIEKLRSEDGCPWDRKQTPESAATYLLEEAYELVEAIVSEDPAGVLEELGDVLFHIFFIAHMYSEKGMFDVYDAAAGINEKMIRRHPHVFGEKRLENARDVKRQWRKLKKEEKGPSSEESVFDSIPRSQPALMRAGLVFDRMGEKEKGKKEIKKDVVDGKKQMELLGEKLSETGEEAMAGSRGVLFFGRLFFTLVKAARANGIDPERCLHGFLEQMIKEYGEKPDKPQRN
jgi:tetrapyrrole methylase family protein/MazG family protein